MIKWNLLHRKFCKHGCGGKFWDIEFAGITLSNGAWPGWVPCPSQTIALSRARKVRVRVSVRICVFKKSDGKKTGPCRIKCPERAMEKLRFAQPVATLMNLWSYKCLRLPACRDLVSPSARYLAVEGVLPCGHAHDVVLSWYVKSHVAISVRLSRLQTIRQQWFLFYFD